MTGLEVRGQVEVAAPDARSNGCDNCPPCFFFFFFFFFAK